MIRSRRSGIKWLIVPVLSALCLSSACSQPVSDMPKITIVLNRPGHRVLGFGAQIWSGDMHARPVLRDLNMRYVRMTVGPNWQNVDAAPPTDATPEAMDRFLEQHFDGDDEPRLQNAKQSWHMTDQLGIQVIMIQFTAPENWLSRDGQRRLLPEYVDDFARYWGSLVAFMDTHGMRPPYIELSNEPEGDWNTKILPAEYDRLTILTRHELNDRGFNDVKIVGPGLAWLDHDGGGRRWVQALSKEGVAALGGWSSHAWDDKFDTDAPVQFMQARWRGFRNAIKRQDPEHTKPIFITEYATGATTFNGVAYDPVESDGSNRASDSSAFAQRVFEQTLLHVNQGAAVLIYWEAADQPWNPHAWGLLTSPADGGQPRPSYVALSTLLPHIPADARALIPHTGDDLITATGFLAEDRLTIALANGSNQSESRIIVLTNAPPLTLVNANRFVSGRVERAQPIYKEGRLIVNLPPESTLTCLLDPVEE